MRVLKLSINIIAKLRGNKSVTFIKLNDYEKVKKNGIERVS